MTYYDCINIISKNTALIQEVLKPYKKEALEYNKQRCLKNKTDGTTIVVPIILSNGLSNSLYGQFLPTTENFKELYNNPGSFFSYEVNSNVSVEQQTPLLITPTLPVFQVPAPIPVF